MLWLMILIFAAGYAWGYGSGFKAASKHTDRWQRHCAMLNDLLFRR